MNMGNFTANFVHGSPPFPRRTQAGTFPLNFNLLIERLYIGDINSGSRALPPGFCFVRFVDDGLILRPGIRLAVPRFPLEIRKTIPINVIYIRRDEDVKLVKHMHHARGCPSLPGCEAIRLSKSYFKISRNFALIVAPILAPNCFLPPDIICVSRDRDFPLPSGLSTVEISHEITFQGEITLPSGYELVQMHTTATLPVRLLLLEEDLLKCYL